MKLYTLATASSAAPFIEAILNDIRALEAESRSLLDRKRLLLGNLYSSQADMSVVEEELAWARQDAARLRDELQTLGVEIADIVRGRMFFYSWRENRPVKLCWQVGEPDVSHWCELTRGFSDRMPVLSGEHDQFLDIAPDFPPWRDVIANGSSRSPK